MSTKTKAVAGVAAGVLVLAGIAFFVLQSRDGVGLPFLSDEPARCPLSGVEPRNEKVLDRPAVAVKIENSPAARPLAGLDEAEVVFEEVVEGGSTRFMALYHCTDSAKAGPVRSAREVDPSIMVPLTRILAFSGANRPVIEALTDAGVAQVDETGAQGALTRIAREGVSSEHTLYASTKRVRRIGAKQHPDPPPDDAFEFGDLESRGKQATSITVNFGGTTVVWQWSGKGYERFEEGLPFVLESGKQLTVDNVLVEEHVVNYSKSIVDVAGNPSIEIEDTTGSGRAVLFRDGRALKGRWTREDVGGLVRFETKSGEEMVFSPGSILIELVPGDAGEVKGSFSYEK